MKRFFAVIVGCMFILILSTGYIFAQPSGKAIVDEVCSKCHGLNKVYSANKKAAQWEVTLDAMIKKGAKVKPEERDPVLKYLNTLNK